MKYILVLIVIMPSIYVCSYIKNTWTKNKLSAIGAAIMALLSIAFPIYALFRPFN